MATVSVHFPWSLYKDHQLSPCSVLPLHKIPNSFFFLRFFSFDVDHFFQEVFIDLLQYCFFHVLGFWLQDAWDLSFPTRIEPILPKLGEVLTSGS